jgi:hypothetical protein
LSLLRKTRLAGACLAVLFVAAAAGASPMPSGPAVPFVRIAAGAMSRVQAPAQLVIRDDAGWHALWRRHAGPGAPPAPAVGFDQQMVIAIFAGQSPGGATVHIAKITRGPDGLVVWYTIRETRPQPAADAGRPSTPFEIVKLARSPLRVTFTRIKIPPVV